MSTGWISRLRRFFGFDDTPAKQRARRRASRGTASVQDGFAAAGIDMLPDFAGDPEPGCSDAGPARDDTPACGALETNSGGGVDTSSSCVVDTNISSSFDMNSGISFDAGGSCGGGSGGD